MAGPTTPTPHHQENAEAAMHTRDVSPSSPSNLPRRAKRTKTVNLPPSVPANPGKNAATETTATQLIKARSDQLFRKARVQKDVLDKLAGVLDNLVASYDDQTHRDHRQHAKQLVGMVLDHLNVAVFAASDNTVAPHLRLPATRPPSSAPVSSAPPKPTTTNKEGDSHPKPKTWAGVASNGLGASVHGPRSVTIDLTKKPSQGGNSSASATSSAAKPEDIRVLVTFDAEAQRMAPYLLRREICRVLQLSSEKITHVKPTPTGFAIHPADKTTRGLIVAPEAKAELSRNFAFIKIALPEKWYTYAVQEVPYTFFYGGQVTNTRDVIADEVYTQTGLKPVDCKPSRHSDFITGGRCTWIISLLAPARNRFTLFDCSAPAKLIPHRPKIVRHNPGCQVYCAPGSCTRVERCPRCGGRQDEHIPGQACSRPAQCANCYGPFMADHDNCPAAPYRASGKVMRPSRAQLKKIRAVGLQLYKQQHSANTPTPSDSSTTCDSIVVNTTQPATEPEEQTRERDRQGSSPTHTPSSRPQQAEEQEDSMEICEPNETPQPTQTPASSQGTRSTRQCSAKPPGSYNLRGLSTKSMTATRNPRHD